MAGTFRFSFGPWNIFEGADPFGPAVRDSIDFNQKLACYKELGFDAIQLHDDDVVPDINTLTPKQINREATAVKARLEEHGLVAEFVAPRLWEHPHTIDGGFTSNDPAARTFARDRSQRSIDIARVLGTDLIVLWFAREGTYLREAKDSKMAVDRLIAAINDMLDYDEEIRIAIEPKPNEPMDHNYIPTTGHAVALAARTLAPDRVGVVIESAHAILAGLDPSDEMGFALAFGKLMTVHLNDQNGLKFDQDKVFGSVDLRRAFNQVRILDKYSYGNQSEWIGLDVKAMRTQKDAVATKHLRNSRDIFLKLLNISRNLNNQLVDQLIVERDYEELEWLILQSLIREMP